ncbi:hypothetical protein JCM9957A_64730 [Kineosporia succinea]
MLTAAGSALPSTGGGAISRSRLTENQLVDRFGVAPKTVTRWLRGRTPQARFRAELAELLGVAETELWPAPRSAATEAEMYASYSDRSSVPHQVWRKVFGQATGEIGVLVYSGLSWQKIANSQGSCLERLPKACGFACCWGTRTELRWRDGVSKRGSGSRCRPRCAMH